MIIQGIYKDCRDIMGSQDLYYWSFPKYPVCFVMNDIETCYYNKFNRGYY